MMSVLPPVAEATERPASNRMPRRAEAPKGRMVLAIVWKELRQNGPMTVAILFIIALLIVFISFIPMFTNLHYYDTWGFWSLLALGPTREMGLYGCAAIGGLIGLMQSLRERQFDAWSFLVHRPASRTILFAGRVLGGLILYAISAGVPITIVIALSATRWGGSFFYWRFALPTLAHFLLGIVFYGAGLLVGARPVSIIGSRLIPVGGAIICGFLAVDARSFSMAALIMASFAGLFLLAAWGAELSHGYTLRAPLAGRSALFALLLAGLSLVLWAAGQRLKEFNSFAAREAIDKLPDWVPQWSAKKTTSYVVLPDGTIAKQIYTATDKSTATTQPSDSYAYIRANGEVALPHAEQIFSAVTELERHSAPVRAPETNQNRFDGFYDDWQMVTVEHVYGGMESADNHREPAVWKILESWYFLRPRGIAYGYDEDGRPLGELGADGFVPPGVHATPAKGVQYGWDHQCLVTEAGVYTVDYPRHSFTPKMLFPPGAKVIAVQSLSPDGYEVAGWNLALTESAILLYPEGDLQFKLALPLGRSLKTHYLNVTRLEAAHRWVLRYSSHDGRDPGDTFDIFDDGGTRVEHLDIAVPNSFEPPYFVAPEVERITRRAMLRDATIDALTDAPLMAAYGWYIESEGGIANGLLYWSREKNVHISYGYTDPAYAWISAIFAALSGLGMLLLASRYGARWRWAWVLSAVIVGPVMLMMLIATHFLPGRVRCASCGRSQDAGRTACKGCGTAFPPPARTGTEVFV